MVSEPKLTGKLAQASSPSSVKELNKGASFPRADYALSNIPEHVARIDEVVEGSPAERAGLEPGMVLTHVEGHPLRDMIDWNWYADGPVVTVEGMAFFDEAGNALGEPFEFECTLERTYGESWGLEFQGAVFDGIRTCKNACVFCFMSMLPKDMRDALYLRDDDYRLSFLQGNFVTFTNMTDEDVQRVIDMNLSPLNMSIHASAPEARKMMIGKNEARGIEVLEQLLAAGIEIHGQIVLCPDLNDGDVLQETLEYIEARPGITSVGIVPLGFTKHQKRFHKSFADPQDAARVIAIVEPFQKRSREKDGITRYQLADEFYLWNKVLPPAAETYDGYPQYYDGIGMYRSFVDDFTEMEEDSSSDLYLTCAKAQEHGINILLLTGMGFGHAWQSLLDKVSQAQDVIRVQPIKNEFFGGNVDVTGLICAEDVLAQLNQDLTNTLVVFPEVMFNFDGLTLDGMSQDELFSRVQDRGGAVLVTSTEPKQLFFQLATYLSEAL